MHSSHAINGTFPPENARYMYILNSTPTRLVSDRDLKSDYIAHYI